jgi:hypothetical protein
MMGLIVAVTHGVPNPTEISEVDIILTIPPYSCPSGPIGTVGTAGTAGLAVGGGVPVSGVPVPGGVEPAGVPDPPPHAVSKRSIVVKITNIMLVFFIDFPPFYMSSIKSVAEGLPEKSFLNKKLLNSV